MDYQDCQREGMEEDDMNPTIATERQEQAAVFEWAAWAANQCPEVGLLFAVPNGQMRRGTAAEPGLRAGVPDMMLPVARGQWHGLFIELKRERGGVVRPEQREWLERLECQGYRAVVARGADAAIAIIERYLEAGQ